jgi:multidrug resistance efflux pump
MRKGLLYIAVILVLTGISIFLVRRQHTGGTIEVTRGPMQVWTVHSGVLESRDVVSIMSILSGPATLVEVIADGTPVRKGDILARFDASPWERDLLRSERDYRLARADLETLVNAKLPLEVREMSARILEAESRSKDQARALADCIELQKEGLLADYEVRQAELRAEETRMTLDNLRRTADEAETFVHPSILERANATLQSASNELTLLHAQVSNCVMASPVDSVAVHKPVPVGSEFRTVRVGDSVFRNQPFMILPDVSNLLAKCDVPETEINGIQPGAHARLQSLARRNVFVDGVVESVGSIAHQLAGSTGSMKYFTVSIRPAAAESHLKPGMSIQAWILAAEKNDVLMLPRTAVWWEAGQAFCRTRRQERCALTLGLANETHFEVLSGLNAGDSVVTP